MIRRMTSALTHLTPAAVLLIAATAGAQRPMGQMPVDRSTDAPSNRMLVDSLATNLTDRYVFPETAASMVQALTANRGRYETITSSIELADRLTADLQATSHDKHLRVVYRERDIPERTGNEYGPEEQARQLEENRIRNFGFEKVQRMMGNVGYIEMRSFAEPDSLAARAAMAAMTFLANVDALIIDLRNNGGGSPDMVALVTSYLYAAGERVHLNNIYWRDGNHTEEFWMRPDVPGPRLDGKDVFVLTSNYTFSAAEEFCYNLKNLKRATIVGEETGGGAHPGEIIRLSPHFEVFCPTGRAINPISKTNWEGTSVTPDLVCNAEESLSMAHIRAIENLLARASDPDVKQRLAMAMDRVKAEAAASGDNGQAPPGGGPRIIVRGN